MDRMEAVLLEWDVYGELEWESSFEQSQLEIALLHSTNDHQTCLFLQMCLREASVEQIVAIRERIHNIEDSLTAHMKRCNKRSMHFNRLRELIMSDCVQVEGISNSGIILHSRTVSTRRE